MRSRKRIGSRIEALLVLFAVGMLATPLGSVAASDPGPQSGQDTVSADQAFTYEASKPFLGFSIDARIGPSGENPTGTISYGYGTPTYNESAAGIVTCVAVAGNRAVVGGYGLRTQSGLGFYPNPPPPPSNYGFYLVVADNGPPAGNPPGGPDQADLVLVGPDPPTTCTGVLPERLGLVVGTDIVVHDAPPLPTSKEQCKNGGWRSFGIFKNQGECVSFVATGGKRPPSVVH